MSEGGGGLGVMACHRPVVDPLFGDVYLNVCIAITWLWLGLRSGYCVLGVILVGGHFSYISVLRSVLGLCPKVFCVVILVRVRFLCE